MSHIVRITTEIRDAESLQLACRRLGLPAPVEQTVRLFSAAATGHCVQLPDWRYPVVCELATGQVHFDNYEGRWGDPRELGRLKQSYAVERAKQEARRRGHSVVEQSLTDGSIRLTVSAGGAA